MFLTIRKVSGLWHERLRHANIKFVNKLFNQELVVGLPKMKLQKDKICDAC